MLGVKQTCPECTMDIRFINTWHDPVKERDAAASLFDAGADVVFTGADTPAVAGRRAGEEQVGGHLRPPQLVHRRALPDRPVLGLGPGVHAHRGAGQGQTYKAGYEYFDGNSKAMGLFGFMDGQTVTKGVSDLPEADVTKVKETLAKILDGSFGRFDVFAGPIKDNTGKEILAAGAKLEQSDLDQFPPGAPGNECKTCMYWWSDGITVPLPDLS
jgi:basic membrane protein A